MSKKKSKISTNQIFETNKVCRRLDSLVKKRKCEQKRHCNVEEYFAHISNIFKKLSDLEMKLIGEKYILFQEMFYLWDNVCDSSWIRSTPYDEKCTMLPTSIFEIESKGLQTFDKFITKCNC